MNKAKTYMKATQIALDGIGEFPAWFDAHTGKRIATGSRPNRGQQTIHVNGLPQIRISEIEADLYVENTLKHMGYVRA